MKQMKNKIYRIALVVAISVITQSCFVAKDYDRPNVVREDLYRDQILASDSTSIADISWNKLFTDPILQQHITTGLQNNLDIRIAIESIKAAEAAMKQGRAGYFPTLNLGADWSHQELSKNSQFGALGGSRSSDQYQFSGNLSWEADIWGKIRSNKRATNARFFQTIAANQAVKTQLIANIASTYFQLLTLDSQLSLAKATLVNRNAGVETIRALKDAGNVTEVGVKQTEAQKFATELIIADIETNVVLLENAMSVLLNIAPQKIQRSTLEAQQFNAEITTGVPATLLRNRPDVVAAEYNFISNFEYKNVARSNFYPTFRITASGGFQSIDIKEWFSANSLFANIVSGLTQPIFNQRAIRTQYEISQSDEQRAYLQFEQSLLNAGREVSDALAQYQSETLKLAIRQQQVDALNLAANYSDELLNYGLVNYLEVLTVKDNALNSELTLIDNKFRQYNAVIQLYKALGGGWQ